MADHQAANYYQLLPQCHYSNRVSASALHSKSIIKHNHFQTLVRGLESFFLVTTPRYDIG